MFFLKHFHCCNTKVVIGRDGPMELGQHCAETTFFSALCSVVILAMICHSWPTLWRSVPRAGTAFLSEMVEQQIYITGCNRLTVKGSRSDPLFFSSIPLLLSSSQPQSRTIQAAGPMWGLVNFLLLSFLPLFLSSLAIIGLSMVAVFYPMSVLNFPVRLGSLWLCDLAC